MIIKPKPLTSISRDELLERLKKDKEDLFYCIASDHLTTYFKLYDITLLIKTNEIVQPLIESNQEYRDNFAQAIKGLDRYKTTSSIKRKEEYFKRVVNELNPTLAWLINVIPNE